MVNEIKSVLAWWGLHSRGKAHPALGGKEGGEGALGRSSVLFPFPPLLLASSSRASFLLALQIADPGLEQGGLPRHP